MAGTQVMGMNKRNAADDDNDNENLMIAVGGNWVTGAAEKVIDKNRNNTKN